MNRTYIGCPLALAITFLAGCNNDWKVTRQDPETIEDFNYRFDETDARNVARDMVSDALSKPWLDTWLREHEGRRPILVVGDVKNKTEDYIETNLFTSVFEEELINSSRVRFKARQQVRQELRDERLDTEYNDPATIKAIAKEVNADLILVGTVDDDKDRSISGRKVIAFYQVALELINVETAEILWKNTYPIKKRATR